MRSALSSRSARYSLGTKHEGGASHAAAPRLIISACGILDHPLSRVMTTECVTHLAPLAGRGREHLARGGGGFSTDSNLRIVPLPPILRCAPSRTSPRKRGEVKPAPGSHTHLRD